MVGDSESIDTDALTAVSSNQAADSAQEVFRRCEAADALGSIGPPAISALPSLLHTLVVPVRVDCGLALRVAAAAAIWRVGRRFDVVLPFLVWALKDEYWGVAPRAVEVLAAQRV